MPGGRVTLQDVADAAGLSKAATSYALRGLKSSETTQQRVRAIATELGFTANPAAQALAGGRTGLVAISASLRDSWQQGLVSMMATTLRERGYAASIADVDADPGLEATFISSMRGNVDGVIALPTAPSGQWWRDLDSATAVVAIGEPITARAESTSVVFDNVLGVTTALNHLLQLGHRSVTMFSTTLATMPSRAIDSLASRTASGLGLGLKMVTVPPSTNGARSVAAQLFAQDDRPTAAFCLSDSIAFGVYLAARDLKLTVPSDLSILGYDDNELAKIVDPPLSTFGWDEDAIVDATISALIATLEAVPIGQTRFSPRFIERSSTAPPPRAH
ncbi:MAG: LacI family DNA-binding transcriptional regulator [Antricoccus sp.]